MIDLKGMISIQLLKKSAFTGSNGELRYRMAKKTTDDGDKLSAAYWKGPYCWEATKEEEKVCREFELTDDGLSEAVSWLNQVV